MTNCVFHWMDSSLICPSQGYFLLTLFLLLIFTSTAVPIGIQGISGLQIESRPILPLFHLISCRLALLLQQLRGMDGDHLLDLCKVWPDYQTLRSVTVKCTNSAFKSHQTLTPHDKICLELGSKPSKKRYFQTNVLIIILSVIVDNLQCDLRNMLHYSGVTEWLLGFVDVCNWLLRLS